jgi:hypothetical protein
MSGAATVRSLRPLRAVVVSWWLAEVVRPRRAPVPWPEMARAALAICVPLSVSFAAGRGSLGVLPATGGLLGTLADAGGPYLNRVKRVCSAAVFGGAPGLVIGAVTHGHGWLAVMALVVVAGVSGLLSARGGLWSGWSGWPDSNRRPPRPKRGALAKLRYSPYLAECSGCPGIFAVRTGSDLAAVGVQCRSAIGARRVAARNTSQSHQHHQHRSPGQLKLIMKIGPLPDACRTQWNRGFTALGRALDPGFHCARTHWIRGFMAFRRARRTRNVTLVVPV